MIKNFTPGPWNLYFPSEAVYPGIDQTDGAEIIMWGGNDEDCGIKARSHDERIATAHLIAAAPDLLEALETLMKWSINAYWDLTSKEARPPASHPITKAEIAMRKALNCEQ